MLSHIECFSVIYEWLEYFLIMFLCFLYYLIYNVDMICCCKAFYLNPAWSTGCYLYMSSLILSAITFEYIFAISFTWCLWAYNLFILSPFLCSIFISTFLHFCGTLRCFVIILKNLSPEIQHRTIHTHYTLNLTAIQLNLTSSPSFLLPWIFSK